MLRRDARPLAEEPNAWRIVGEPRTQKGKVEVRACGPAGIVPLRLLRRNRTDANRELERTTRGEIVIVDAPVGEDRVEVEAETAVIRRDPSTAGR